MLLDLHICIHPQSLGPVLFCLASCMQPALGSRHWLEQRLAPAPLTASPLAPERKWAQAIAATLSCSVDAQRRMARHVPIVTV
jgi:hypothetical protein